MRAMENRAEPATSNARVRPAWAAEISPWNVPWHEVVAHHEWFSSYPDAPPFAAASELRLRVLRRRPGQVPSVLGGPADPVGLLRSPLATLMDGGVAALEPQLQSIPPADVRSLLDADDAVATRTDLSQRVLTLLSPAADALRAELVARAAAQTRRHFQRRIRLFAPLYLSSFCHNRCAYCHFSLDNPVPRTALNSDQIRREARALADTGVSDVLLLTGEAVPIFGVQQLAEATAIAKEFFDRVRVEVFPLATADYAVLRDAGASGVTLYQETYDTSAYAEVHHAGRKRDLLWRLGALERAATAGLLELGLGALFGLANWRYEALAVALHADALRRRFPDARVSVSFPRLRQGPGGFQPRSLVSDADLEHAMAALRLVLPDSDFVLSTREPAALRDHWLTSCVTRLSAGSITRPGGYAGTTSDDIAEQFETHDDRSPNDLRDMLHKAGFEVR